jgi:Histidine kinase-, DNA gyrase B-, and HSP90-like ATPase
MTTDGFDTTPKPAFLLAMQNQKWTVAGALSELVDNSFGPGRGNARQVHITHDMKHRTITVLDNGAGMESIGRLFQLGNTIGRAPGDIGLYGAGGTMAILWLASRVEVWTLRDGQVSHDQVHWAHYFKAESFPLINAHWQRSTVANTPAELFNVGHGTLIRVHLLPSRVFHAPNVHRDLARTYAPALRQGRELRWTTLGKGGLKDQRLCDPLTVLDQARKRVQFDLVIEVGGEHLPVHGMIGIVEDLPQTLSVVSIGFGPRVITTTRDCYSSADGTEQFAGVGVAGWLDLGEGWQPYLATTKDAMNDQPAWDALMGHVFTKIRPFLQERQHEKIALEFQDICLTLDSVFDGATDIDVTMTPVEPETQPGGILPGPNDGESGGGTNSASVLMEPSEEGEPMPESGKSRRIFLEHMTDHEMGGVLCRAYPRGHDTIGLSINIDHDLIKQAIEAKPVNRLMLHYMAIGEMAVVLIDHAPLLRKVFTRRALRALEEHDGDERRALIVRILVDRIARKAS